MYNNKSFQRNNETGKSELEIEDFKIVRIGHRPEEIYQFNIQFSGIEAELAATGTIDTDSSGRGTDFSWDTTYIKSQALDQMDIPEKEKEVLRKQIANRIELFLRSYCPDIFSYPFKDYSESWQFKRWSGRED